MILSDKAYTWSGTTRVLEHDNAKSGSPISKEYFEQGILVDGIGYYYSADGLGSLRQLIDAGGVIAAQYDYDPYGNRMRVDGIDIDVGYAGYWNHRCERPSARRLSHLRSHPQPLVESGPPR